jgi:hypothetical protein
MDVIGSSQVIVRSEITQRQVGAKCFVVTPAGRMVILDNESSCFLWDQIVASAEVGCTIRGLTDALVSSFQVTVSDAEADVIAFVRTLERETLVDVAPEKASGSR